MDGLHAQMVAGRIGELGVRRGRHAAAPSDYFARNCWIGASFPAPVRRCSPATRSGIDKIMWGSDYPHHEATSPYSKESLRRSFAGWEAANLRKVLSENAAAVYGFDLAPLAPLADQFGPTVDEIAPPLDAVPADATSPAFHRS